MLPLDSAWAPQPEPVAIGCTSVPTGAFTSVHTSIPTGASSRGSATIGSATIGSALAAPSVRSIRRSRVALQVIRRRIEQVMIRRAEQRPIDAAGSGRLHGHELEIIEAHAAPASLPGSPLACRTGTLEKGTR
jgi:hypothetical protein